jgi:hypothetical protein
MVSGSGQNVWTFNARPSPLWCPLARTAGSPGVPNGVSYFIFPMDSLGLTIVPIRDLSGASLVYQAFIEAVEVAADHLIGELGAELSTQRPYSHGALQPRARTGQEPPVLELVDLAARGEVPSAVGDELLDLCLECQRASTLWRCWTVKKTSTPAPFQCSELTFDGGSRRSFGGSTLEFAHDGSR